MMRQTTHRHENHHQSKHYDANDWMDQVQLLRLDGHPDAHAEICGEQHDPECLHCGVHPDGGADRQNADQDGAEGKDERPGEGAGEAVGFDDVVVVGWMFHFCSSDSGECSEEGEEGEGEVVGGVW